MLGANRHSKAGLRFDAIQNPIGGRIRTKPTEGNGGGMRKQVLGAHLAQASIDVCTSCTRTRCTGSCEKIMAVEREAVKPKYREAARKRGYKPQHIVNYRGKEYGLTELSRMCGISADMLGYRLRHGWTVEEAVETPKGEKRRKE